MKIIAYETKDFERADFARAGEYGLEVTHCTEPLTQDTLALAAGCEGITTLGFSRLDRHMLRQLADLGVKYVATRTIGFNHIDVDAAHDYGLRVSNAQYAPYNVADFTVMLMLMLLRKAKVSICRALVNDFSLDGMCGREMRNLTIGIIGTGRIGRTVIANLSGFGCRILAYDPYAQGELPHAERCGLDTLYRESDIISLHMPYTEENRHFLRENSFRLMKRGVLIVNTARGGLINTQDLIAALESGQVGGAGLDTIESEEGIVHSDLRTRIVDRRDLFYLKQFPNVIFTSHYAFFTEEATASMVECALKSLSAFGRGEANALEI